MVFVVFFKGVLQNQCKLKLLYISSELRKFVGAGRDLPFLNQLQLFDYQIIMNRFVFNLKRAGHDQPLRFS
jgi:hypothetical protein